MHSILILITYEYSWLMYVVHCTYIWMDGVLTFINPNLGQWGNFRMYFVKCIALKLLLWIYTRDTHEAHMCEWVYVCVCDNIRILGAKRNHIVVQRWLIVERTSTTMCVSIYLLSHISFYSNFVLFYRYNKWQNR